MTTTKEGASGPLLTSALVQARNHGRMEGGTQPCGVGGRGEAHRKGCHGGAERPRDRKEDERRRRCVPSGPHSGQLRRFTGQASDGHGNLLAPRQEHGGSPSENRATKARQTTAWCHSRGQLPLQVSSEQHCTADPLPQPQVSELLPGNKHACKEILVGRRPRGNDTA